MAPSRSFSDLFRQASPVGGVSSWRIFAQIAVYMVGFSLLLGIDYFFQGLVDDLEQRISNERSRLQIGEVLVQDLNKIEGDVYRMTVTSNIRGQQLVLKKIHEHLKRFGGALDVLENGGTLRRETWLNMESRSSMERRIEYQPNQEGEAYVLEAIDLRPKITDIKNAVGHLATLLSAKQRLQAAESASYKQIDKEIARSLRTFVPLFTRMAENTNRLFYISQQRLIKLEADVESQNRYYAGLKIYLAIGVIGVVLLVGYLLIRQVSLSNRQLQELAGDLTFQKFALDQHAIAIIANQSGKVEYANGRFCDLSNRQSDELLEEELGAVLFGEQEHSYMGQVWELLLHGEVWRGEIKAKSRGGSWYWLDATIVPFVNEDNKPFKYIAICTDISPRKRMQEQVDETNKFLQSLTDNMGEGVYALDAQGNCTFINREGERLLGWRQQELIGKNLHDYVHYQTLDGLEVSSEECVINRSICSRESYHSDDQHFFRRDGSHFPISMVAVPIYEDDDLTGSVAVFQDISLRKKSERDLARAKDAAEEASLAKSRFLANMSHEIRTPMNAIIGMSYLALRTRLDDRQRGYIEKVHHSAEHLLGVINDILDFSKIEANKLELEQVEFSLEDVMANLANVMGLRVDEKGLDLLFDLATDVPQTLVGDPLRLTQVLVNLSNNAVKFTEQGEVVVSVRVQRSGDERVRLRFAVRDSGIGMTPQQQKRLFGSFSQADASTTRKYGGTGLGLSISKGLVEMMQGEIGVTSALGEGSTFSFEAEFGVAEESGDGLLLQPVPQLEGLRTLVIDDNAVASGILAGMLSNLGMRADEADGCSAALQMLEACRNAVPEEGYQLLMIDSHMPQLDGLGCIEKLSGSGLAGVPPVIMTTFHSREEALKETVLQRSEVKAVLSKPAIPTSLLTALSQALNADLPQKSGRHKRKADDSGAMQALSGARVLLVEDNEYNQELATELLQIAKVDVAVAANGREALEMLESDRYDGVLMDCQMPVMDGYTATREIRAKPEYKDLPVIAMTANAMVSDIEAVLACGMNDHIAKPIDVTQMFGTMARWIKPSLPQEEPLTESGVDEQPGGDADLSRQCARFKVVDAHEGVGRMGGDWAIYRKLLKKFATNQIGSIESIRQALAGGDFESAVRVAHTLKGTAASVGAMGLSEVAAELENRLNAGSDQTAELLLKADEQLQAALLDITTVAEEQRPVQAGRVLDHRQMGRLIARLRLQLAEFDTESEETLNEIMAGLPDTAMVDAMNNMRRLISQYDFEVAETALEQFCTKYNITESAIHGS